MSSAIRAVLARSFALTVAAAAIGTTSSSSLVVAQDGPTKANRTQSQPTETRPDAKQAKAPIACRRRPGMLGVARKIEIDTGIGPRFGLQQYKENDFLKDREVVLTFDDGPLRRNTRAVLAALKAHCTQATFFMVGQMAASDPEMVREVASQGHTIAIHTWSHRNLKAIGAERAKKEFELGLSVVQKIVGQPVAPFFRFPYLADSKAMLGYLTERHFGVFSIDTDSLDYRTHSAEPVRRRILRGLEADGKGILLFHDIQASTAKAIGSLLDTLAERGFKVVHLVAKRQATTLAKYDDEAAIEIAKRSRTPLGAMARRSIVYPIANPDVAVVSYAPIPAGQVTRREGQGKAQPKNDQPAAKVAHQATSGVKRRPVEITPAAAPAPQPAPEPFRGTQDENDWRKRVFNN